ncbi:MAG: hypothetical protein HZA46_00575 [Planctomycetales bacterium]|nr:hypothetical protein [Planctomycetales bacterium]
MKSLVRVLVQQLRSPWLTALVAVLIAGFCQLPTASASDGDVTIERIEIGFGGYFKVGNWSPLFATVKSTTARSVRIVVESVDPDEHIVELPGPLVTLPAGQPLRLQAAFRSGRLNGKIAVRVEDESGLALATRRVAGGDESGGPKLALRQDVLLWATLGHPPGFESGPLHAVRSKPDATGKSGSAAEPSPRSDTSVQVQVVPLDSTSALPGAGQGRLYESLNTLVMVVGEKLQNDDDWLVQLTADQSEALRDWVSTGGHLVLAVGARATDYRSSPLAEWIPVSVQPNLSDLRQLTGLEAFSGRNQALSFPGTIKAAKLDATELSERNVLVQGAAGPLLVRVPFGLGRVTILGLDITRPPLANWKALDAVCRKIASDLRSGVTTRHEQRPDQLGRQGITELASQLHAAQDQFATINRPSIWSVMGLILGYIVVLGPLDYFVVQRVIGRSTWTWVTFPALVCLASAASLWAASRWNGEALQVNQMDVLDVVDLPGTDGGQIVRGRTWFNVFSPETATYRIATEVTSLDAATANAARPAATVSWSGVPEDAVGGMYRIGGLNLARRLYRMDEAISQCESVPLLVGSSKSFEATWNHAAKQLVISSLESSGVGRLDGTIAHALPMPLEDCLLAYGGRLYRLSGSESSSSLAPHQEWSPSQRRQLRDLKAFLTNTIAQREQQQDKNRKDVFLKETPYDPTLTDRDVLVRMLTFHQAAGGTGYTGLNHDLLRSLDLSEMMQLGRAVLMGRIRSPVAKVLVNGQAVEPSDRATYVRFIVPVKQVREQETE